MTEPIVNIDDVEKQRRENYWKAKGTKALEKAEKKRLQSVGTLMPFFIRFRQKRAEPAPIGPLK